MKVVSCAGFLQLCLCGLLAPSVALATDGTYIGPSGRSYDTPSIWSGGVLACGEGATLAIDKSLASGQLVSMTTNVTLGHIVYPADGKTTGLNFQLNGNGSAQHYSIPEEQCFSHYGWNAVTRKLDIPVVNGVNTNVLTIASGDANPATIERLSGPSGSYAEKISHNIQVNMPVLLESDLLLRAGPRYLASIRADRQDVSISGNIAEATPGRKVIVAHTHPGVISYLAGDNSFTGGLEIRGGTVRAGHPGGRSANPCTALGLGDVFLTSEIAGLDLHGQTFSSNQTLYVSGTAINFTNAIGNLRSENYDSLHVAKWQGPVRLSGDLVIGAGEANRITAGIEISGSIAETKAGCGVQTMNGAPVRLTGQNTYSGPTVIGHKQFESGILSARPGSLGSGPVVFYGGIYRMYEEDDLDVTTRTICSSNNLVRIELKKDFAYTPQGRIANFATAEPKPVNFYKAGLGSIVFRRPSDGPHYLSNGSRSETGDVTFDYANGEPLDAPDWNNKVWSIYGTGRMTVTNLTADTSYFRQVQVMPYACLTLRNDSEYAYKINGFDTYNPNTALLNVEAGGPLQTWDYRNSRFKNPGIMAENWLWHNENFLSCDSAGTFCGFDGYVTSFEGATMNDVIDMSSAAVAELAARATPVEIGMMRFDDIPGEDDLTVTLPAGENILAGGTILVTANMGARNIRICGGALLRPTTGAIRVLNFSRGTVTIASDIHDPWSEHRANDPATMKVGASSVYAPECATSSYGTWLVVGGTGKVVFSGDNRFGNDITIHGCEATFVGTAALGRYGIVEGLDNFGGWMRNIRLQGGAKIVLKGDISEYVNPSATLNKPLNLRFVPEPGNLVPEVCLPEKTDSLTLTQSYSGFHLAREARLKVTGKGRLLFPSGSAAQAVMVTDRGSVQSCIVSPNYGLNINEQTAHPTYEGVTIEDQQGNRALGRSRTCIKLDGAKLKGKKLLDPSWQTDGNQSTAFDYTTQRKIEIGTKGAVYDLDGTDATIGLNLGLTWNPPSMLCGGGTLVFTNSSATRAVVRTANVYAPDFTGEIVAAADFSNDYGLQMPNAGFTGFAGHRYYFGSQMAADSNCVRLRYLRGDGAFEIGGGNYRTFGGAYIGGDDGGVYEFAGYLGGYHDGTDSSCSHGQYFKVGRNTWVLSGETNRLEVSTHVCGGTLKLMKASSGVGRGCLGASPAVILGDERTRAGDDPTLLVGAAVGFGHQINVPDRSSPDALPKVGGDVDGVMITNVVKMWRDVALLSNAGTTTFTKLISGTGTLWKAGAGTVKLETMPQVTGFGILEGELQLPAGDVETGSLGAVINADGTCGGTLAVDGAYALLPGAVFNLKLGCDPKSLDKSRVYTLVTATGGITGSFASVAGVPEGWRVRVGARKIMLVPKMGMLLIVR